MIILKLVLFLAKYAKKFTTGLLWISFRKIFEFFNSAWEQIKANLKVVYVSNKYCVTKLTKTPTKTDNLVSYQNIFPLSTSINHHVKIYLLVWHAKLHSKFGNSVLFL